MNDDGPSNAEARRLQEDSGRAKNWKRWWPYLAERQWATVREDYSADNAKQGVIPLRALTCPRLPLGEDGLLGVCDRECRLGFALALWNGNITQWLDQ